MIYIVSKIDINKVIEFCKGDPFGCKISSLIQCYGVGVSFIDFWIQYNNLNIATAAICRLDREIIVYAKPSANKEELNEFFKMMRPCMVLCSYDVKSQGNVTNIRNGLIMEYNHTIKYNNTKIIKINPKLDDVYKVLKACNENAYKDIKFEQFYVDMFYRIKHKTARCVGIYKDDILISCAMTVGETKECAVIGAVSTLPNFRNNGNASNLVKSLLELLLNEGKSVFIFLINKEKQNFYSNIGFKNSGIWTEFEVK